MTDLVEDGLTFSGYVQPPSVPADPTGESWRGEKGATGATGATGSTGATGATGAPGGVVTFNTRNGTVTLTAADVTGTGVMAAPGAIGGTTPAAGTFASVSTVGSVAVGTSGNVLTVSRGATSATTSTIAASGTGGMTLSDVGGNFFQLVTSGGFPRLKTSNRLIFSRSPNSAADTNDFQFDRVTSFTGGTGSNINANMRVTTNIGAGNGAQEWNFLAIVNNASTTVTGQAVAGYFQANRTAGTNHTFAVVAEASDQTGLGSAASGSQGICTTELDLSVNGADDAANSSSYGGVGNRSVLYFSIVPDSVSATQTQVAHGIWFSSGTSGRTNINYGSTISYGVNTQTYSALDTRGVIAPTGSSNPVNAVTMAGGHVVDFSGGAALNSAPGRYLTYASSRFSYFNSTTELLSCSDAGDLTVRAGGLFVTAPKTPASASATGTIGQIAWDTSFLYVCTATNTWKRAAIATW